MCRYPTVPDYPLSKSVLLDDKPVLDQLFSNIYPGMSEFTFANIYLFRKTHDYRLSNIDSTLVILAKNSNGSEYAMIPGIENNVAVAKKLLSDGVTIYTDFNFIERYEADDAVITFDRNSFDYIYSAEDLAELTGNKYHKKRNRISYFTSRHNYSVSKFNQTVSDDALKLLSDWQTAYIDSVDALSESDYEAAVEAITLFDILHLDGVAVYSDEKLSGFALGEMLNSDTAVCHFEKCDPFTEGVYQLVNREFAAIFRQRAKWINREQDLGDEGLRKAKFSYHPSSMKEKFRISAVL